MITNPLAARISKVVAESKRAKQPVRGFQLPAIFSHFVGGSQLAITRDFVNTSEEKQFFRDKVTELCSLFESMPKVYEQDGKGDDAIVHLHYFIGGCDWWITERDTTDEQIQAFGFACLGDPQDAELGYISIQEIIQHGAELDYHWTPVPLSEIKKKIGR